jgi:hypothetical protein
MARLRYNGLSSTLGGSLTSSATSVTFGAALTHSNGTAVPTISGSDYIPLAILDTSGHLSEVVYLTAYTSGATSGTIARGKEGTTGVSHSSGDAVIHGPTASDITASSPLAYTVYSAGTSTTNNTTTLTDVDATNLAITFTVPPSGNVLVRLTATIGGTGTQGLYWGLRESTSDVVAVFVRSSTANDLAVLGIPVSGLTPGSSHTYKWAQKVGGASASVTTFLGLSSTLALMEVWALP